MTYQSTWSEPVQTNEYGWKHCRHSLVWFPIHSGTGSVHTYPEQSQFTEVSVYLVPPEPMKVEEAFLFSRQRW